MMKEAGGRKNTRTQTTPRMWLAEPFSGHLEVRAKLGTQNAQ